ncbi:MAG: PKD domain-containing protein [Bacteroidota bacterium]|nr:PKD domain-containing protein [Bacteroidota bacterium]
MIIFFLFAFFLTEAQLKANFNAPLASGCAPLVVNFNDASTGDPIAWKWDLGNGTISFFQNPSVVYFDPGTYTVKLIIRNSLGIDSVIKVQYITVYFSPVVNFTGSPLSGCFPLKSQFNDLSFGGSGSLQKWEWDFGDGSFSDLQNPNHTYTTLGNFHVSLRAINSFGCVISATVPLYVHINSGVKAAFTNSTPNSCNAPSTISFTNSSLGNNLLTYQWNFGDGSTSILPNPAHTYISPGNFSVTLIATNSTGCTDTLIKPNVITIGSTKADFSLPTVTCQATTFNLKNTSSPTPGSAFWDFGDGTFSHSKDTFKVFNNAGNYTIKMVADFGACKDSVTKTVNVVVTPNVDFSAFSTVSCKAPFTVNFTNASSGGATYFWDFGDGNTSTQKTPSHVYLAKGNYPVKLFVANASGCGDSIVKKDFIRIKKPVVSIDSLPQKGCAPLTHTFTANVNSIDSITSYQWNFGDGNFSDLVSPSHVYNIPGKYTVTLIYATAAGCTDSVKVVNGILVGTKPQSIFSVNPLNACADKSIQFTDISTGNPNEWLWFFGDGSSSSTQSPTHEYNDTGYFSVTLIAVNNGCADTVTIPNEVHINPPGVSFSTAFTCAAQGHIIFKDQSIGANTWNWNFGDGASSTIKNPSHDYSASGIYPVTLTVTNQLSGCSKSITDSVKVVKEIADFISSDSITCKNSTIKFTASKSNPANINSYTWNFGDGVLIPGTANSISYSYSKASSYNVSLILKDVNGCFDTIIKPLAIHINGPTASFHPSVMGTCLNNIVSFFDSSFSDGVHPIKQWKWYWGDGTSQTFTVAPFVHNYAASGNYSVSLRVTDSFGCVDSVNKIHALIVSQPIANFSGDTLSCTSVPVKFYNVSTGPQLIYSWNFGDGATSSQQNPVHQYNTEGTYSVSLNVTDLYGCKIAISKTNYIKIANPRADFILSDSVSSCPPLVVNFTNTSTNYSSWNWDFGDGTASALRNPSHFYASAGTFNVVLTASGPAGCTSQKTKQIRISGPSGSFSYTNLMGCSPLTTGFRGHTSKNNSFVWDFNDGTAIPTSDSIINHIYAVQGKYLPKMILMDASGCKVPIIGKDTIQVFGVEASFVQNNSLICDSGMIQFSNTSINNDRIIKYLWNFGDGASSDQPEPAHQYNNPGLYNISLSVVTQRGCKDDIQNKASVKVSASPQVSIGSTDGACVPAVINFTGKISNPDTSSISWKWDLANGNASTQQNPAEQNYSTPGTFAVKAIATNSSGCANTASKTIDIYPLPSLITSDAVLCAGSTVPLQVSGANTYSWSPATYLSCTSCANPIVSKADSAVKYIVKGFSDKGCISTDSALVTVKFPFKLSISKPDTLCLGKSVQLSAAGTERYTWSPSTAIDDPLISSPTVSPSASITYRVIGSDSKGCFKDTGYVPISVFPIPGVNAGTDKTINVGSQVEIIPQISKDVTSVLWSPSNGIVSINYHAITVKPTESIEYTVDVINAGGCMAEDKISIFVLCNNTNVFVPNTFSPNGDGTNDVFYPRGSGVFKIKNLKIFNRWGELVFERSNFNANDASSGWDGSYNGKKLPPDVFVYMLEVTCENNTSLLFKGNIALIK